MFCVDYGYVCDICGDVWIMDTNVIYIMFYVMEYGYECDIYYVLCDGKSKNKKN